MNRVFAIIIMAAMIIASVFFGSWRSLSVLRNELDDIYLNGAKDDVSSVCKDLDYIAGEAYNLATIAQNYFSADNPTVVSLLDRRRELTETFKADKRYDIAMQLKSAVSDLYFSLKQKEDVTEQHMRLAANYYQDIESRFSMIGKNSYNSAALAFNKKLDDFPTFFIAPLVGIDKAPLFA